MLSALVLCAVAVAPDNPYLVEARALAGELRFADAITRLEVAKTVPSLDEAQRREVLELLARCQVAEGRRADALATFTELLEAEPAFALDREATSPKILEVLDEAKAALYPADFVRLEEVPAPVGLVRVRVVDPWARVTRLERHERRDGGDWQVQDVDRDGPLASFPLVLSQGGTVDWYVVARDADGLLVAHLGDAQRPHSVSTAKVDAVARAEDSSRGRRIAGWVLVGAAVVAAGVATGLEVNGWNQRQAARDASQPPGDWADTARAAEASGQAQMGAALGLFVGAGVVGALGAGVLAW